MKRILFTLAIACFAITGTAQADIWGRMIPNSLIAQGQDTAETVPSPAATGPAVQAPAGRTQNDGYPFADRCGGCSDCCANVWAGYSSSCGLGFGRGMLAHSGKGCGCGRLHGHGKASKCCGGCGGGGFSGGFGGCFNSFAGGGCGCGGAGRFGWQSGGLQGLGGCGCGKHFHKLRHACGFGCNTDCALGGNSAGCSSCNGQAHQQNGAGRKMMAPPTIAPEPTPEPGQDQVPPPPPPANEKSAFRSWYPSARQFSSGF